MKKTLVLGASPNADRYAYRATERLAAHGFEPLPVGVKKGKIGNFDIVQGTPQYADVDTVTLYINPNLQKEYYDYILSLKPQRIIYNPGTENPELMQLARAQGIENVEACTLVMLATGQY